MSDQPRHLYRSQTNKVIAGVCGGIAEYLNVDPTVVRVAWILLSILPLVPGIIIYIVAWFVIPKHPSQTASQSGSGSVSGAGVVGVFFIILGTLFLLSNLHLFHWREWWDLSWDYLVPVLLIAAGVMFILKPGRKPEPEQEVPMQTNAEVNENQVRKTLRRSKKDRKIFGVCGGLAEYFDIDPSLVRVAFVVLTIWPFGLGILAYGLLFLLVPDEEIPHPQPQS